MQKTIPTQDIAIILAAHGSSRDVRINRPLFQISRQIEMSGNYGAVTPAFLDGQPSVQWVLDEIEQPTVVVIPFMTSNGYYTKSVFPKYLQSDQKTVRFSQPIGLHSGLVELVEQDLNSATSCIPADAESTVVIVGHGTRRNRKSCLTTIDLVKNLRSRKPNQQFKFAFIDQRPEIEHVFSSIHDPHVVVVPFLMGLGPHSTCDVPVAFGSEDLTTPILDGSLSFPIRWKTTRNHLQQEIQMTRPVGTYGAWASICIELVTRQITTELAA